MKRKDVQAIVEAIDTLANMRAQEAVWHMLRDTEMAVTYAEKRMKSMRTLEKLLEENSKAL